MELPAITRSRKTLTILDLVVFTAILAIVLAGVRPPAARAAGVLVLLVFGAGSLLWWLSGVEIRRPWVDALAALAYIALVLISFALYGLVFVLAPTTLVLVIAAQFLTLLYVSFRA